MSPPCRTGKEIRCCKLRVNALLGRRSRRESERKGEEVVEIEAVVIIVNVNNS